MESWRTHGDAIGQGDCRIVTRTFRGAVVAFAVVLIALTARAQTASFHNTVPVPAPAPAPAKRLALVVGNSHYKYIPALDNPQNDARLIATTLTSLGFTLVGGGAQIDLDKAFEAAIRSFGRQIGGADVALFYYAGHGLQVHGTNWLVPDRRTRPTVTDLDSEMVDAELVLKQMEAARHAAESRHSRCLPQQPVRRAGDARRGGGPRADAARRRAR